MKPFSPTRSPLSLAAVLCLLTALPPTFARRAAAQANRQGHQPPASQYSQPHSLPNTPRALEGRGYQGGYGQAGHRFGAPQTTTPSLSNQLPQTGRNARSAYPQSNYPQSSYPQSNYPQSSYPQSNYPQSTYPQANGYSHPNGYAQPQNNPSGQNVPNRNANYGGMNQQPVRQNPAQRFWQQQPDGIGPNATRGEHLQQWMQQHNNLNTQDQQRALQREPGFNQLPQQTQQRMLDRLQRLNSMPTEQRERTLQRSEQMERLSPMQRGEVRSAMGELGALSQDRRRAVARSFRELRPLSPDQRNQMLNSPAFRQQFSDGERNTLNNLLTVSPMLPQQ